MICVTNSMQKIVSQTQRQSSRQLLTLSKSYPSITVCCALVALAKINTNTNANTNANTIANTNANTNTEANVMQCYQARVNGERTLGRF